MDVLSSAERSARREARSRPADCFQRFDVHFSSGRLEHAAVWYLLPVGFVVGWFRGHDDPGWPVPGQRSPPRAPSDELMIPRWRLWTGGNSTWPCAHCPSVIPFVVETPTHIGSLAVDQPSSAARSPLALISSVVPPTAVMNGLVAG